MSLSEFIRESSSASDCLGRRSLRRSSILCTLAVNDNAAEVFLRLSSFLNVAVPAINETL